MENENTYTPFSNDLKVFISYASEDKELAMKLFSDLKKHNNITPWLDSESIIVGQNWKNMIINEIKNSSYFLALLSSSSITKNGFVQKELKIALDYLEEYSQNEIFIIPVRLDECDPTDERIKNIHWVDLFQSYQDGLNKILQAIQLKAHNDNYEQTSDQSFNICIGCIKNKGNSIVCKYCGYDENNTFYHPSHLKPRKILNKRYMIGKVIGQGAFGITYIGLDKVLLKKVAIKEYFPSTFGTRDFNRLTVTCYDGDAKNYYKKGLKSFIGESKLIAKFSKNPYIQRSR